MAGERILYFRTTYSFILTPVGYYFFLNIPEV